MECLTSDARVTGADAMFRRWPDWSSTGGSWRRRPLALPSVTVAVAYVAHGR